MDPFPHPLFPLICTSICVSTLALIFATFIISISPALWVFPAAFIATTAYHAITLLISSGESMGSARLFSLANLLAAYSLTAAWVAVSGVGITFTVLLRVGKLRDGHAPQGFWSMVVPCICSLAEILIMGFIVMRTQKERGRILYAAKWKWRPGYGVPSQPSQWSMGLR